MNIPSYNMYNLDALIEIQALIRQAIQDESDTAARALDDLLANKPKYRATALFIVHTWLHPYK